MLFWDIEDMIVPTWYTTIPHKSKARSAMTMCLQYASIHRDVSLTTFSHLEQGDWSTRSPPSHDDLRSLFVCTHT